MHAVARMTKAQELLRAWEVSPADLRLGELAARDGDRLLVGNDGSTTHLHWRDDGWTR